MGDAIGQVLVLALGIALSPIPIIAVVLILGTPRAATNGPAFLVGFAAGIAVVGAAVLLISGGADASEQGAPADWVSWLKIVLGLVLIRLAMRTWRARPQGDERPDLPEWMHKVDALTPARSVVTGLALAALNPKNLVLTLGAAAAIAETGASSGDQVAALAVFVILATLGPALPVGIYLVSRERAKRTLAELESWMALHSAAIVAVICLLIAAKLIGDAITSLT